MASPQCTMTVNCANCLIMRASRCARSSGMMKRDRGGKQAKRTDLPLCISRCHFLLAICYQLVLRLVYDSTTWTIIYSYSEENRNSQCCEPMGAWNYPITCWIH